MLMHCQLVVACHWFSATRPRFGGAFYSRPILRHHPRALPESDFRLRPALAGRTPLYGHQPDSHQYLGAGRAIADDLQLPGVRRSGRADVLGPNFPDLFRRAADYVDKILRGTKPSDILVEQPTKFDLVINLTTAKALGLTIPPTLLALADEVIE
jgi:hypothetical protein